MFPLPPPHCHTACAGNKIGDSGCKGFAKALKENQMLTSVNLSSMFLPDHRHWDESQLLTATQSPPQKGGLIDTDLRVFRRKCPGTARDLECPDKTPCHGVTHRPNVHQHRGPAVRTPMPRIDPLKILWRRRDPLIHFDMCGGRYDFPKALSKDHCITA